MRTRAEARRGLAIYLGSVVVMSAALEGWVITHGGLTGPGRRLVLLLMYVPLAAWLLPVLVGFLAYGVAWGTGLAPFAAPAGGELARIGNPVLRFLAMIPIALTVGTVMSCIPAFGEEIGWRGYLVPRLVEAEVPAPFLTSSLIWGAWHIPLILWAGYAVGPYPELSALLFLVSITPVGLLMARWRMASGSVWPCVMPTDPGTW